MSRNLKTRLLVGGLSILSIAAITFASSTHGILPGRATDISIASATTPFPDPAKDIPDAQGQQTIVLSGGCFWGMEAVFEHLKGVSDVVSGYSGGDAATANYEAVSSGNTGHAESVKITYDPTQISFGQLLKVYFSVAHDPTQLNQQEPDHGSQYRSAVFYTNSDQQQIAQAYIAQLDAAHTFNQPIVTQLAPLSNFYAAEEHHQNFIDRNPGYPYVVAYDLPKLDQLREQFPNLYH